MANYLKMLVSDLFLQLALVNVKFLSEFFDRILEEGDVFVIFFTLDDDFLDLTLFLTQDLGSLGMSAAFLVQFQFDVTNLEITKIQFTLTKQTRVGILYPGFQFANDTLAADQRISFHFFQTDRQVFDFHF